MAEKDENVRSVGRALEVLLTFDYDTCEQSLVEISKKLNMSKATVLRLLKTLELYDFIKKSEISGKYILGFSNFKLGKIFEENMSIVPYAVNVMKDLAERTGETINLNQIQGNSRVCIHKEEGHHELRQFVRIGQKYPLFQGASGKILLAYMERDAFDEIVKQSENFSELNTDKLRNELDDIKQFGYSVTQNERQLGASAVSAPIFDHNNKIIASLTISGASARFSEENISEYIQLVKEAANQISKSLS